MGTQGYLALVLHAHLPFVRHPEHERFLEEDWFYEAITGCYLPLLEVFEELRRDNVPFLLTLVLTPTLLSMLSDDLLRQRYLRHLDRLIDLTEREVHRTRTDSRYHPLAQMYRQRFRHARQLFQETYRCDLIQAFAEFQRAGRLEIFTSAATHAFLPLLQPFPEAVAAQIRVAVACHQRLLGCAPQGIWLPECGYFEGLDSTLAECGLRAFVTDAHGVLHADHRPMVGVYAPILTPTGVAAFGRDLESSRQVWSAREGYPGDPEYREFYRDIGYDLDLEYIRPFVQATGERKNTGIKYHRITGPTADKLPYRPEQAALRAEEHAAHFVEEREGQAAYLHTLMGGKPPMILSPYDAELFGHWWFEGPRFLGGVMRRIASSKKLKCLAPIEYLRRHSTLQLASPSFSSWGQNGYSEVWLNQANDWIYNHIHRATGIMISLAGRHRRAGGLLRRALNQAARELMLAQSSDWAFIMKMGTMVDYAVRRTKDHLLGFNRLADEIRSGSIDQAALAELEAKNNLFPEMDYRCFRKDYLPSDRP